MPSANCQMQNFKDRENEVSQLNRLGFSESLQLIAESFFLLRLLSARSVSLSSLHYPGSSSVETASASVQFLTDS